MQSNTSDESSWVGDGIVAACNLLFGWYDRVMSWFTGRQVSTISTSELQQLQAGEGSALVLVDVRSEAEQAVSKIPGAITATQYEADPNRYANKIVVPYCTVGGRSYLFARKLAAGGVEAKNYRDSILGWCRAGLPLETPDGEPTYAVHPYWRIFRVPQQYDIRT